MNSNNWYFKAAVFFLVIGSLVSGCNKREYEVVDIPAPFLDMYYFREGSYWTYQDSSDANRIDSLVVDFRAECSQAIRYSGPANKQVSFGANYHVGAALSSKTDSMPMLGSFEFLYAYWSLEGQWVLMERDAGSLPAAPDLAYSGPASLLIYNEDTGQFLSPYDGNEMVLTAVTVPAGTFDCYELWIRNAPQAASPQYPEDIVLSKVWLSPQVGLVQAQRLDGTVWQLRSYQLQ